MRILYAGDSPAGGPANYLLAILRHVGATVRHVPPTTILTSRAATPRYDAIILSDFPHRRMLAASERAIVEQVSNGTGLLMVGGWASFAAGGWRGTAIERCLPVACRPSDDRIHLSSGAVVCAAGRHAMFRGLSFLGAPAICGVNHVRPRGASRIVLTARAKARAYPLLVIGTDAHRRVAALTTDLAPHWCGGLVDWGTRRLRLPVTGTIRIEVGDRYVRFVSSLLRWLVDGV